MSRLIHLLLPVLLLLTGCAKHELRLPQASADFGPSGEIVLPAEFRDGWIIVETRINGRGPYRLILDTGASLSGISPGVAQELGLKQRALIEVTDIAGQTGKYPLTYAETLKAGGFRLEPVPLIIADVFEHFDERLGVVGVLGYIGLDAFTLDLDYPAEQVRVSENPLSELESDVIPLHRQPFDTPHIEVTLLDGEDEPQHMHRFGVDSGGEMILNIATSEGDRWVHRDLARPVNQGLSLSGTITKEHTGPLLGSLAIGQVVIDRAAADIDAHSSLIGHKLLRQFRVRLDPRSGLASLTPADPTQKRLTALQFGGIGVNMTILHNDQLSLIRIAADSPAAHTGLRPNDKVLAIDGVAVTDPAFIDRTGWMFDPPPQVTLTIRRKDQVFDVTVPTMPLFPENLDQLRNAVPDLEPPSIQVINRADGTQEFVFPDGSGGVWNPAEPKADH